MRCHLYATRRLNPQVCDTGRASALRSYPSRYISAAGSEGRAGCRCTPTLAGDLVAARLGLRRACIMMWRPCSGGRADVRSHHWVGILAHADYGPALLRLPLTCRSADLGPPRPRQCGPPGPGSVVSPAATGFAVADLSERTRPVATVRCRRQQCSDALERRGPSAMPTGLEL